MDSKAQLENPPAVAAERPRRVIKRYSNRKLYDTQDSRYITLLQIAEMVRGGEEVQIIDNTSKEDLTEVTLAQIIYEEQKQRASSSRNVPLQTLKELIHQRTEKVLSDLREGPIGRLIPGGKSEPPGKPEEGTNGGPAPVSAAPPVPPPPAPPVPAPVAASAGPASTTSPPGSTAKPSLVDQAKETLEDWQHKIDERVKAVVPNILPWQQLQHEVKRLNARIEELEAKLRSLSGEPEPPPPEVKPTDMTP